MTSIPETIAPSRPDPRWFIAAALVLAVATAPFWSRPRRLRLFSGIPSTSLPLPCCGTCSPDMPVCCRWAQQAFVGLGAMSCSFCAGNTGFRPISSDSDIHRRRGRSGRHLRPASVPAGRRLFRHRHLGGGRNCDAGFHHDPSMGGGAGMSLPAGAVKAIYAGKELRVFIIFWLVAGLSLATLFGVFAFALACGSRALMAVRDNGLAASVWHRHLAHAACHLRSGRRHGGWLAQ